MTNQREAAQGNGASSGAYSTEPASAPTYDDMEYMDSDPLRPARGIVNGIIIAIALWCALWLTLAVVL